MNIKSIYLKFTNLSEHLKSISLFLARLLIAYGFYEPAMNKWADIDSVANWFSSMSIPFPLFNAYMAASTEIVGVIFLTFGFLTRLISIPLIVIMVVAIITVHLPHGFSAGNNGFEIPLYYMVFLIVFIAHGAGKISFDRFIFGEKG